VVQVQLSVRRGREAIEFYKAAFGVEEIYRFGGTDDHEDVVCRLSVNGAPFWVEDESPPKGNFSPETLGGSTERLLLIVEEPGDMIRRAVGLGATEVSPLAEEHGWLLGRIDDPFGHRWEIGQPLGTWPPSEGGKGSSPLPVPGHRSVVVDSKNQAVAITETTSVKVVRLASVDVSHVVDEGEGFESVAEWRAGHERFWHSDEARRALCEPTFTVDNDTAVVLERFRVVERHDDTLSGSPP
jgi:PhnB protein